MSKLSINEDTSSEAITINTRKQELTPEEVYQNYLSVDHIRRNQLLSQEELDTCRQEGSLEAITFEGNEYVSKESLFRYIEAQED
jgi:hypothetical protein